MGLCVPGPSEKERRLQVRRTEEGEVLVKDLGGREWRLDAVVVCCSVEFICRSGVPYQDGEYLVWEGGEEGRFGEVLHCLSEFLLVEGVDPLDVEAVFGGKGYAGGKVLGCGGGEGEEEVVD
jgi:hypothetical protein